jgi:hypothetical protein
VDLTTSILEDPFTSTKTVLAALRATASMLDTCALRAWTVSGRVLAGCAEVWRAVWLVGDGSSSASRKRGTVGVERSVKGMGFH